METQGYKLFLVRLLVSVLKLAFGLILCWLIAFLNVSLYFYSR